MKCKLISGRIVTNKTSTIYFNLCSAGAASAVDIYPVCPTAGTLRNLRVMLSADPDSGGSAKGYVITVRKRTTSYADTALTVTILSSTANFRAEDIVNEISVTAGNQLEVSCAQTGSPANNVGIVAQLEFESPTAGESILMGGTSGNLSSSATYYAPIAGDKVLAADLGYLIAPCDGMITMLYGYLTQVPGTGNSRTLSVHVNGSDVGTGITYTAAQNGLSAGQSQSISIAKGDRVSVSWSISGSPTACAAYTGVVFAPTTDGDFIIAAAAESTQAGTLYANYIAFSGSGGTVNATEALANTMGYDDFYIKSSSAYLDAAPGSGSPTKSYTLTFRAGDADCSTPFTIAFDDNTQGPKNSATASPMFTPTQWQVYDTKIAPANSPAAVRCAISYCGTMVAASGPSPAVLALLADGEY